MPGLGGGGMMLVLEETVGDCCERATGPGDTKREVRQNDRSSQHRIAVRPPDSADGGAPARNNWAPRYGDAADTLTGALVVALANHQRRPSAGTIRLGRAET